MLGAASLYLELLVVRWTNAYVRNVGFFTNFLVVASFAGLGIGMLVARRFAKGTVLGLVPLLLLFYCGLVHVARPALAVIDPGALFWGDFDPSKSDATVTISPEVFVCIAYAGVTIVFSLFGHALGLAFASCPPLRGYAANIAGSLLGIVLFTAGSFVLAKPAIWFTLVFAAILPFVWAKERREVFLGSLVAAISCVVFVARLDAGSEWSPYYRMGIKCAPSGNCAIAGNGVWLMHAHSYKSIPGHDLYSEVYGDGGALTPRRYDDMLVIGAGSGNDVNVALQHGVARIDAVEINPLAMEYGKRFHPDRPYDSPKVTTFIDDGRAFLRHTPRTYDLVVYALPDSVGTVSGHANMRIESYLFTVEAFRAVRSKLKPDGVFAVYNHFRELWLVDKLTVMLTEAFGEAPLVFADMQASAVLVAGPGATALQRAPSRILESSPPPATDDWPFLYLAKPHLPEIYARSLAAIGLLTIALFGLGMWFAKRFGEGDAAGAPSLGDLVRIDVPMFLMGTAFMMLEAKSIVTFGLLFGSTWITTAFVIGGILVMVLLAVLVTSRARGAAVWPWAIALFAALALVYVLPPERFVLENPTLRYVVGAAAGLSPVLFANVVFARLLGSAKETERSLASNLLGSVVGGIAEYAALVTGHRALVLVVGVLYALAFLSVARSRRPSEARS